MGWFGRINKGVGSFANWAGLFSLFGGGAILSALGTWAASAWEPIAAQGWGAMVFAGVGLACILMLTLSASLVAYRWFWPITSAEIAPTNAEKKSGAEYVFGLAAGDRNPYVEGEIGRVMAAFESRIVNVLEDRARSLKIELAPQDRADEIRRIESDILNLHNRVNDISEALRSIDRLAHAVERSLGKIKEVVFIEMTISTLDHLLLLAPPVHERQATLEFHTKAQAYLQSISEADIDADRRGHIETAIATSQEEAESILRIAPPELIGRDLLNHREWTISVRQVAGVVRILEQLKFAAEKRFQLYRSVITK